MAFSWVGFREAYDEDMARQREDRLRLDERAQRMLPAIMERRNMERQAAREAATKLSYLEQRGLSGEALNALYGDQTALDAIFQETSRGKWVDYDADTLNDRVRFVGDEVQAGSSWRDSIKTIDDTFASLDFENVTEDSLRAYQEYLYAPARGLEGTGTVEIRSTSDGTYLTPEQRAHYEVQRDFYDENIIRFASAKLDGMEAGSEDAETLRRDIQNYEKDPLSRDSLRREFGDMVITGAAQSEGNQNIIYGIENNPYIFGPEPTTQTPEPTVTIPQSAIQLLQSNPSDDVKRQFEEKYRVPADNYL